LTLKTRDFPHRIARRRALVQPAIERFNRLFTMTAWPGATGPFRRPAL
jgi:hypothetical protein